MKLGTLVMGAALAAVGVARRRRLTAPVRVALLVLVCGLLVAGSGLVHLPSVQEMVRDATATLGDLTYLVVGGLAFAESGAFIGLVAPAELLVIFGGVSAGHDTIELPKLIAIVWACALTGDLLSYQLGRRFGRDVLLRHGAGLGITEQRLARVEGFLDAHSAKTILVGRFIGLARALAPFIAGTSRFPARRFMPAALVAAGVWAVTFSRLGYLFWASLDTLIGLDERGSIALAVVATLVVMVGWLQRRGRDRLKADAGCR